MTTTAINQPKGEKPQPNSAFVQELIEALKGERNVTVKTLIVALQAMSAYIQKVRQDVAASEPLALRSQHLPAATNELEAVVQATAEATHSIMDATEAIQAIALTLDDEPQQMLLHETTRIFEACTFQDITGQRVTKVVRALDVVEQKLDVLIRSFGDAIGQEEAKVAAAKPAPAPSDAATAGPRQNAGRDRRPVRQPLIAGADRRQCRRQGDGTFVGCGSRRRDRYCPTEIVMVRENRPLPSPVILVTAFTRL
jgi:chemotaxis protein CheZ